MILYVVDLVRCENPNTFMSSMMYCVSIMFRLRLPVVIVFNKVDACKNREQILNWLTDYDALLVR